MTSQGQAGPSKPRARADQEALNLTPSRAATTQYSESSSREEAYTDVNDGDDKSSDVSMYTYTSADASQFKKEEDGRSWNVLNQAYFMPTDDEEWARLNKQHVALLLGLGGLYPAQEVVRAVLAPREGETKRILDLGCGSGVWTIAMAKEFPHAQVLGVDLAPTPLDMETPPKNCIFEIDDINPGLPHYESQFDVVHCRIIGGGLRDCWRSKLDAEACLKPGGILIWMDVDYDLIEENMEDFVERASDTREGGSWAARMLYEMSQAALSIRGSDIGEMGDVLDEGFWSDPLMDPERELSATLPAYTFRLANGSNVRFELIGRVHHSPSADPIPEQLQRLSYMGALMRQDVSNGMWTFHGMLKKAGISEETLKEWSTKGDIEMAEQTTRTWSRWILAWGRRRKDGPTSPIPSPTNSEDWHQTNPYPYFISCDSQEEALAALRARAKRREAIPIPSMPLS